MTTETVDPFAGGDSLPGFKFENVGDKVVGQVLAWRTADDREPSGEIRTWSDGKPKQVIILDLDTNQDGEADTSLWVRGNMFKVVKEAIRSAGIETTGAMIKVTHTGLGDKKPGLFPAKLFAAEVKAGPPIKPKAADAFDDEAPF